MKSKSTIFIIIIVLVVVLGGLAYYFLSGTSSAAPTTGLVSTNTGSKAGISPSTSAASSSTGDQVVALLRNLSVIQLSDAVFQNPSFAMLTDISITLPPVTDQGRRNPFAAVGTDMSTGTTGSASGSSAAPAGTPATRVGSPSGF